MYYELLLIVCLALQPHWLINCITMLENDNINRNLLLYMDEVTVINCLYAE